MGGTDASFPVLFASVETGIMTSAFAAGGCAAEDSKNVACSVAVPSSVSNMRIYAEQQNVLAYCPSRPVSIKLSSWRMKLPGSAKSGV